MSSMALCPIVHGEEEHRLKAVGMEHFPLIVRAGEKARYRFLEFFTAQIRNRHTRRAYAEAVRQFFTWCEERGFFELAQLNSVIVAVPLSNSFKPQHGRSRDVPISPSH